MEQYFVESYIKELESGPVDAHLQQSSKRRCFCRAHIHSAIEMLIVKTGTFEIYANDRKYIAGAGDMVLLRSNTIHHTYSTTDSAAYYVIRMRPSLLAELSNGKEDSRLMLFFSVDKPELCCFFPKSQTDGTPLGEAICRFTQEYEQSGFAHSIAITLGAAQILLEILRVNQKSVSAPSFDITENTTKCIYETLVYINQNYNLPISATDCSNIAGMSYSYFSRTFKAVIGKSFKEYLNETRINHAQKLLCSQDLTVTEVASLCGFDSVSYFISVYKTLKGVTPYHSKK